MRALPWLTIAWLAGCTRGSVAEPAIPRCDPAAGCVLGFAPEIVASGFASPVHLAAPAGDPRVFVVEQAGTIRTIQDGRPAATPFLDLTGRVLSGGERGLLSVAFHPGWSGNGRLFVYYTAQPAGQLRISELHASDPASGPADAASEVVLLAIDHPTYANHNGGQLAFGPDGLLYAGTGDGGGGGDPDGNAQDPSSLLGKLLRIDPDAATTPVPGNPFGNAVYQLGLRNPWRWSFDRLTGDLYVGDVGQDAWEEVDFAAAAGRGEPPPPGTNWGWNRMEGAHCYSPPALCATAGLTLPIAEYPHPTGEAITGGFVYRGAAMPGLAASGTYFYADFYAGFVRTLRVAGGVATEPRDVSAAFPGVGNVASFGEDGRGELYLVSYDGTIRKLVPAP